MYKIHKKPGHLLVEFTDNFTAGMIQAVMHHEASLPEFKRMNDIWLIGKHWGMVSLGDFEPVFADLASIYPKDATRNKTALVIDPGLTDAIVRMWVRQYEKQLPFECRAFHSIEEAEAWLGVAAAEVAR